MLETFRYKDSIISVEAQTDAGELIREEIANLRHTLEGVIKKDPYFQTSHEPISLSEENLPEIIREMLDASKKADVGPMAAVAGTVSELICKKLKESGCSWAIVENGGDIFCYGDRIFKVSVHAGNNPVSERLVFEINPKESGYAICTSSGKVGHSISFGNCDATIVFAKNAAIADAFATAIANKVGEIEDGILFAKEYVGKEIDGVFIVKGRNVGKVGKIPRIGTVEG